MRVISDAMTINHFEYYLLLVYNYVPVDSTRDARNSNQRVNLSVPKKLHLYAIEPDPDRRKKYILMASPTFAQIMFSRKKHTCWLYVTFSGKTIV